MFNDFQADSEINGYSRSPRGYSTNDYIHVNICGNLNLDEDNDVLRPLCREDYLLIYNISGKCHVRTGGKIVTAQKGELVVYKPDEPQNYFYRAVEKPHNYWVHFSGTACEKLINRISLADDHLIKISHTTEIEYYFSKLCVHYHFDSSERDTVCGGLLLTILGLIAQYSSGNSAPNFSGGSSRSQQLVSEVISMLKMNDMLWMNVDDCAERANLSSAQFTRIFKNLTGLSPLDYITKTRMNRARELLLFTDFNIEKISELCGYRDQNYFTRIFKKNVGLTPTDFRKQK